MNTEPEKTAELPLHELNFTPDWVKKPSRPVPASSPEPKPGSAPASSSTTAPRRVPKHRDRPTGSTAMTTGSAPTRSDKPSRPKTPPAPAPVEVEFLPEDQALQTIIETLKHSRRAHALFDLAKLLLHKAERHRVRITCKPDAAGNRPPLYFVAQAEAPFLTRDEAARYIFQRHFDWIAETVVQEVEPPKGNFTFVNRCGITGEWLGPPNYHEYQNILVRHHQTRIPHVPFDEFKAKIQTVRDETAVKAWLESMSKRTEYVCRLGPEPRTFTNRRDLEKYVADNFLDSFVTPVHELVLSGVASRNIPHPGILQAVRQAWEAELRFPLKLVNTIRPTLQKNGFAFFKLPNGVTFVNPVRVRRFEAGTNLTDEVRQLLTVLRSKPKGVTMAEIKAQLLTPQTTAPDATAPDPTAPVTGPKITEERIVADLHWLIADGYVVEFTDGRFWAPPEKKPAPPAPQITGTSLAAATEQPAPPATTTSIVQPAGTETSPQPPPAASEPSSPSSSPTA
ncbi:MAG: hypothetical protein RMM51_05250 [Verrucomicrobiae bacterium]|nr:hypothetical protein [Verrucomicrobiae bacterium]